MIKKIDYDHLNDLIMEAVHCASLNAAQGNMGEEFGTLIEFLENAYVKSIVGMIGAMLAAAKLTNDPDIKKQALLAARGLLSAPEKHVRIKVMDYYHEMIEALNLPDALREKTHNEIVADQIMAEMDADHT